MTPTMIYVYFMLRDTFFPHTQLSTFLLIKVSIHFFAHPFFIFLVAFYYPKFIPFVHSCSAFIRFISKLGTFKPLVP